MKDCTAMRLNPLCSVSSSLLMAGIMTVAAVSVPVSQASATVIAGWDFNGLTDGGTTPFSATTSDASVTVTGLARTFAGAQANAGSNTWGSNGLTAQNKADAITFGSYFSFAITSSTSGVSLSDIATYNIWLFEQNPASVPTNNFFGAWQYRINSVPFADIGSSFQLGSVSQGAGNAQASVSLSGLADLQSMAAGTQADFRLVVWGAGYGANYAGFNSFQSGNDLVVNGTVAVPEPSTWVIGAVGIAYASWETLRRRKRA